MMMMKTFKFKFLYVYFHIVTFFNFFFKSIIILFIGRL